MKTKTLIFPLIFLAMLIVSCNFFSSRGVKMITPSDVNMSENRDVSGFTAIDFSTM